MKTILVIGWLMGYGDQFKPVYAVEYPTQAACAQQLATFQSTNKFRPQAYCVPAITEAPNVK